MFCIGAGQCNVALALPFYFFPEDFLSTHTCPSSSLAFTCTSTRPPTTRTSKPTSCMADGVDGKVEEEEDSRVRHSLPLYVCRLHKELSPPRECQQCLHWLRPYTGVHQELTLPLSSVSFCCNQVLGKTTTTSSLPVSVVVQLQELVQVIERCSEEVIPFKKSLLAALGRLKGENTMQRSDNNNNNHSSHNHNHNSNEANVSPAAASVGGIPFLLLPNFLVNPCTLFQLFLPFSSSFSTLSPLLPNTPSAHLVKSPLASPPPASPSLPHPEEEEEKPAATGDALVLEFKPKSAWHPPQVVGIGFGKVGGVGRRRRNRPPPPHKSTTGYEEEKKEEEEEEGEDLDGFYEGSSRMVKFSHPPRLLHPSKLHFCTFSRMACWKMEKEEFKEITMMKMNQKTYRKEEEREEEVVVSPSPTPLPPPPMYCPNWLFRSDRSTREGLRRLVLPHHPHHRHPHSIATTTAKLTRFGGCCCGNKHKHEGEKGGCACPSSSCSTTPSATATIPIPTSPLSLSKTPEASVFLLSKEEEKVLSSALDASGVWRVLEELQWCGSGGATGGGGGDEKEGERGQQLGNILPHDIHNTHSNNNGKNMHHETNNNRNDGKKDIAEVDVKRESPTSEGWGGGSLPLLSLHTRGYAKEGRRRKKEEDVEVEKSEGRECRVSFSEVLDIELLYHWWTWDSSRRKDGTNAKNNGNGEISSSSLPSPPPYQPPPHKQEKKKEQKAEEDEEEVFWIIRDPCDGEGVRRKENNKGEEKKERTGGVLFSSSFSHCQCDDPFRIFLNSSSTTTTIISRPPAPSGRPPGPPPARRRSTAGRGSMTPGVEKEEEGGRMRHGQEPGSFFSTLWCIRPPYSLSECIENFYVATTARDVSIFASAGKIPCSNSSASTSNSSPFPSPTCSVNPPVGERENGKKSMPARQKEEGTEVEGVGVVVENHPHSPHQQRSRGNTNQRRRRCSSSTPVSTWDMGGHTPRTTSSLSQLFGGSFHFVECSPGASPAPSLPPSPLSSSSSSSCSYCCAAVPLLPSSSEEESCTASGGERCATNRGSSRRNTNTSGGKKKKKEKKVASRWCTRVGLVDVDDKRHKPLSHYYIKDRCCVEAWLRRWRRSKKAVLTEGKKEIREGVQEEEKKEEEEKSDQGGFPLPLPRLASSSPLLPFPVDTWCRQYYF